MSNCLFTNSNYAEDDRTGHSVVRSHFGQAGGGNPSSPRQGHCLLARTILLATHHCGCGGCCSVPRYIEHENCIILELNGQGWPDVTGLLLSIDNGITAGHEIIMKCFSLGGGQKQNCDCSIQLFPAAHPPSMNEWRRFCC